MKSLILFFLFSVQVFSQILFVEDFNYPVSDSLEGIGGWNRSGLNSQYNIKVVTPGLTFSGYSGTGVGNSAFFSNNPDGDIVLINFTTQNTGNLYMSCMIRVDSMSLTGTAGYNLGFDQAGGTTNINTQLYIQKVTSTTFRFGIRKKSSVTYTLGTYNINTTYLAVVKYSFIAGADNDSSKIYIFSSSIPAAEPNTPDAFATSGTDLPDIGQVVLSNMYSQGNGLNLSSVKVDGIRVSTSWVTLGLTGFEQTSSTVPGGFYLGQNFPNPFNPVTNIYFSLPKQQRVKLVILNILGQQVDELINDDLGAGTYKLRFDASKLSSGVYVYRLQSEDYNDSRKMLLVK